MICKNCEQNFEGNFCNNCGQKANVKRIDFNYVFNEIPNSVLQINRGFLFTVKELLIRPGKGILAFLKGKRVQYYKPIAFLLITSTLYVLFAYLMERNTFIDDITFGFKGRMEESNDNPDYSVVNWITKYQTYIPLLILPIFSLASYFAFIKSNFNYFEHLVLNVYITGQQMLIYLVLSFIFFGDNVLIIIPFLIGFIYNFWTYFQFFKDKKKWKKFLLILSTYLIFIILIILLIFITARISIIFG